MDVLLRLGSNLEVATSSSRASEYGCRAGLYMTPAGSRPTVAACTSIHGLADQLKCHRHHLLAL